MKVTLYMASSLNGYIADINGSEDFFVNQEIWKTFVELLKDKKSVIFGRKTYEIVKSWGDEYFGFMRDFNIIVITSKKDYTVEKGFDIAQNPQQALEILQKKGYSETLICGGSEINSAFAKSNLLDEIIINFDEVAIGTGIPIFKPDQFKLNLKLQSFKKVFKGVVQVRYKVIKHPKAR